MNWLKQNKWQVWLLAGLVFIGYINGLKAEFVSDDVYAILQNPNLGQFSEVLKSPFNWVQPAVYFLIVNVFGKTPAVFRLVNLAAHLSTAVLSYWLVSQLINKRAAIISGVIMAIHPLQIEAVTWISGSPYSWSAPFMLLSVGWFYQSLKGQKNKLWWSLISFFLGLSVYDRGVVVFGLLVLCLWQERLLKKEWKKLIGFGLLAGTWISLILVKVPSRVTGLALYYSSAPTTNNILVQLPIAISSYLELIFWPDKLTLYHSELVFGKLGFAFKAGVFLVFLGLMIYGLIKRKWLGFWFLWMVICLSPTLLPFGWSWVVAERYVYLASLGIYAVIAMGIERLSRKPGWFDGVMIGFGVIVSLLLIRTIVRNHDWLNQDNLWLSAARTSPHSSQNHNNLGDLYGRHGDLEKAKEHFARAIELNPVYADAMHNLANTYLQLGDLEKAEEYYLQAIQIKPILWQSRLQLASLYYQQGKVDQAINELEEALKLVPDHQGARQALEKLRGE